MSREQFVIASGWLGLFWTLCKRSHNAPTSHSQSPPLLSIQRCLVLILSRVLFCQGLPDDTTHTSDPFIMYPWQYSVHLSLCVFISIQRNNSDKFTFVTTVCLFYSMTHLQIIVVQTLLGLFFIFVWLCQLKPVPDPCCIPGVCAS